MSVLPLLPIAEGERPLEGLYLDLNLHKEAAEGDLLIYANYIASVDGRISVADADGSQVPELIINRRDWRLYQELAAQCDVMITSARYFRQLAKGCAQDLLPVGLEDEYADLRSWRAQQGLKPQPDVMIISNSLDIPALALEKLQDRRILICTGSHADPQKVVKLKALGADVYHSDGSDVSGVAVKSILARQGYRSAYMIAGPKVHQSLIADRVLNYLFLTTRLRLLGGDGFDTILSGNIGAAADAQLRSLYLDQNASNGQLFALYALQQP